MRTRALTWLILLVMVVQAAVYLPQMPPKMASSFGGDGSAKGFMTPRDFLFFEVFIVAIMLLAFNVLPRLSIRNPASVNLPNKAYWLAPERAAATMREVLARLRGLGNLILAFMALLFQATYLANLTSNPALDMKWFGIGMACWIAFFLGWIVSFYRKFQRI